MPDDPRPRKRKTRTREHVVADLGVNYVERQLLLAGYTAERVVHDYGLDLWMKTYNPAGEIEGGIVAFQIKATDHPAVHADGSTVAVRVPAADLRAWLLELLPVILILYDGPADRAFWLDVQEYAAAHELDDEPGETVTLRVPMTQPVTPTAVHEFRDRKERAADRQRRVE